MTDKAGFLKQQFVPLLRQLPSDTPARWGRMTLQQMVEHFSDSVRIASGKVQLTRILTPEEQLPKMQAFLMSDKPFREHTPNALLPETPAPVRHPALSDAVDDLQEELRFFFSVFEDNHLQQTRNSFFGDLTFEQNIHLLYKHALHHLRQFGVEPKGTNS